MKRNSLLSASQQPEPLGPARLIIYVYEGIRKIGPARDSYGVCVRTFQLITNAQYFWPFKLTVELCRDMFPALELGNIAICTKDLEICNGEQAEIFPTSWKDVVVHIREVEIIDRTRKVVLQGGRGISCV